VQTIKNNQTTLDQRKRRLLDAMDHHLLNANHKLALAAEKLETVSPLATLSRGYSITRDAKGKVVRHIDQVKPGDKLVTKVTDGEIHSTVSE
jgi:exodeoxyribonuclease VII large subunit